MEAVPPQARRRRVSPLAPDHRRAALIAATVPLLREHGLSVSTRQIAQAAGVAEGTIFRVFPSKPDLIRAAVVSALDPAPVISALGDIDPALDLRDRFLQITRILVRRLTDNGPMVALLRGASPEQNMISTLGQEMIEARRRLMEAVTAAIEPDRARLRHSPAQVARLLFFVIFATADRDEDDTHRMDSDEIVSVLLDGLLAVAGPDSDPRESTC